MFVQLYEHYPRPVCTYGSLSVYVTSWCVLVLSYMDRHPDLC